MVGIDLRYAMRSAVTVALVAGAAIVHSGCASSRLPPPPSEQLRAELGTVRVTSGSSDAAMVFVEPARGAGEGAMRGALIGFYNTMALGALLGPAGGFVIALAPLGAAMGAAAGSAAAEPAEQLKEKEAAIMRTLTELKIQEYVRGCVFSALREQSPDTAVTASEGERASTRLEITVEKFGLEDHSVLGARDINPPLRFVMTERTRMVRASDGTELYAHWLTWRGQFRSLDDWVAQETTLLKEEAGRACRSLAESLVDEVFLLYLPADER
jgi:hypothetical protein